MTTSNTNNPPESTLTIPCGRLLRGHIVEFLEQAKFDGRDIRWREDKEWSQSVFYVRGKTEDVRRCKSTLERWIAENNLNARAIENKDETGLWFFLCGFALLALITAAVTMCGK